MKPKGILFKGEMIRALLNTQVDVWPAKAVDESKPWKHQTRRVIDPQPEWRSHPPLASTPVKDSLNWKCKGAYTNLNLLVDWNFKYAPHPPGSILYARETWAVHPDFDGLKPTELDDDVMVHFKTHENLELEAGSGIGRWRVGRFMMMKFARLWFRVMNVRVERVNEISEMNAKAEGIQSVGGKFWRNYLPLKIEHPTNSGFVSPVESYKSLWDSINGIGDFDKGKYVWVYEIARITKPI